VARRTFRGMKFRSRVRSGAASLAVAALAGCGATSGTGGLTIPQAPAYTQPQGAVNAQATSRQQAQASDLALAGTSTALVFPAVAGFGLKVALAGAAPASPAASGAPSPAASGAPLPAASGAPSPAASGAPSPAAVAASPAGSAPAVAPPAAASPAPGIAAASPVGTVASTPRPDATVAAKMVAYPEHAPTPPTPAPVASQSPAPAIAALPARTALVRATLRSSVRLELAGLAALAFTVPAAESPAGRGFTIALYREERKKHETLVASDASALATTGVVTSAMSAPVLALAPGTTYVIYLYGDPLSATPGPATYATPGSNPFYPAAAASPTVPALGGPGASGVPGPRP